MEKDLASAKKAADKADKDIVAAKEATAKAVKEATEKADKAVAAAKEVAEKAQKEAADKIKALEGDLTAAKEAKAKAEQALKDAEAKLKTLEEKPAPQDARRRKAGTDVGWHQQKVELNSENAPGSDRLARGRCMHGDWAATSPYPSAASGPAP